MARRSDIFIYLPQVHNSAREPATVPTATCDRTGVRTGVDRSRAAVSARTHCHVPRHRRGTHVKIEHAPVKTIHVDGTHLAKKRQLCQWLFSPGPARAPRYHYIDLRQACILLIVGARPEVQLHLGSLGSEPSIATPPQLPQRPMTQLRRHTVVRGRLYYTYHEVAVNSVMSYSARYCYIILYQQLVSRRWVERAAPGAGTSGCDAGLSGHT